MHLESIATFVRACSAQLPSTQILLSLSAAAVLAVSACSRGASVSPDPEYASEPAVEPSAPPPNENPPVLSPEPDASPDTSAPVDAGVAPAEEDPDRLLDAAEDNLVTFSIDVDTASYTNTRRHLNAGNLPSADEVRLEEFVNYFRYSDEGPTLDDEVPFAITTEVARSPFGTDRSHLMRVAIRGQQIAEEDREPANLVFLVDTSGSMDRQMPLVKHSLRTLLDALGPDDTLSIVTYAGSATIPLLPTPVRDRGAILDGIEALLSGGSTNGAAGIHDAYRLAADAFVQDGINRVVLCTDGDFNVGLTGEPLIQLVEEKANDDDIFLTVLGFGGSYIDSFLEDLTNRGNGNFAFIDNRGEAIRALSENVMSTLQVIAKDVKVQVELDPNAVESYRLLGYHNRRLEDWQFTDDSVDAGELGSGHVVIALIEMHFHDTMFEDDTDASLLLSSAMNQRFATVNVAYKAPTGDVSSYVEKQVPLADVSVDVTSLSRDFQLSSAVAEFAEQLAGSSQATHTLADVTRALDAFSDDSADVVELRRLVTVAADLLAQP